MTVRSFTAAATIAAALATFAAPAMARTVHVMGMTFQQPGGSARDVPVTTGSVNTRHGLYDGRYDGYHGRTVARPAAAR